VARWYGEASGLHWRRRSLLVSVRTASLVLSVTAAIECCVEHSMYAV
jgi:hypothetical protein